MYNPQKEKFIEAYTFYRHCTPSKAKQKYEYLTSQNSSYISELIFGYTMELRKRRTRENSLTYRPFIPRDDTTSSRRHSVRCGAY